MELGNSAVLGHPSDTGTATAAGGGRCGRRFPPQVHQMLWVPKQRRTGPLTSLGKILGMRLAVNVDEVVLFDVSILLVFVFSAGEEVDAPVGG